jgi:hypothetical protein
MRTAITLMTLCMMAMGFWQDAFAGMDGHLKPKEDEVAIHFSGVEIPLNRLLLIRKNSHYCALKFTRCWIETDEERAKDYEAKMDLGGETANRLKEASQRKYAMYVAFDQGDGSEAFSSRNVRLSKGTASWLPLQGPFRPFIHQPGEAYVKCGPFKLGWEYCTFVSFVPAGKSLGDSGFELAPTPWTSIEEVNAKDPRVKWYRYDEKRNRIFIPIDRLWERQEESRE